MASWLTLGMLIGLRAPKKVLQSWCLHLWGGNFECFSKWFRKVMREPWGPGWHLGGWSDRALVKGIAFLWFRFVRRKLRMVFSKWFRKICRQPWGPGWHLGCSLDCALVNFKRYCNPLVSIYEEEASHVFLSGLERCCGSHGVLADTWDAHWTARS